MSSIIYEENVVIPEQLCSSSSSRRLAGLLMNIRGRLTRLEQKGAILFFLPLQAHPIVRLIYYFLLYLLYTSSLDSFFLRQSLTQVSFLSHAN